MENADLHTRFQEAVDIAAEMSQSDLPQDVQLRLYAFYKQATFGTIGYTAASNFDLRNAFKTNAWMQISHMTAEEAMENYISIINSLKK